MKNTPNVDAAEIEQFNRLAPHWWDPQGPCKPLHELNPLRVTFIQRYTPLVGKKALDVGCGGGLLSEALAKRGAQVKALDLAPQSIQVAQQHAHLQALSIDYECISLEDFVQRYPEQQQTYDLITCLELLEHVPDPASIVQHMSLLLKPGGYAFFSTLNRTPKAFLQAILGAEYLLQWLPKGTHHYEKFIKPSELVRLTEANGLECHHLEGITYHPLRRQFIMTPKVDVNYLLCCQKQSYPIGP